ncbi:unnamed protein product [Closterium sp. NIES-65]|nr:unnamed protein product [Closterium sp. NIES-65]
MRTQEEPALPPPRPRHLPPTVAAAGGERQGSGWCSAGGVLCWRGSWLAGFSAGGVLCWGGSLLVLVPGAGGWCCSCEVDGRAGKRCDWRMLALAAATPFPLSSSPPLRPSLFLCHGAATRQRDGGGSIGGLARGPVEVFVGGRAHTRAGVSVSGLAGALVGGSVGGFPGGSVGGLVGALVGRTDGGSVGGFAGGSVGVLAGGSDPGVPGAFLACAVACVAGSARATG